MLTSINSLSSCISSSSNTCAVAISTKNINSDEAVKVSSNSIKAMDDFYDLCTSKSVESFSSFSANRNCYPRLTDGEIDYAAEYQQYMKKRGCNDISELQLLNGTGFATKDDLFNSVKNSLSSTALSLKGYGFTSDYLSKDNLDDMFSTLKLEDVANYYTSFKLTSSFEEEVSCFQGFIDKIAEKEDLDPELKESLKKMSKEISASSKAIHELSEKLKKNNELSPEARNVQKYNALLISNYK